MAPGGGGAAAVLVADRGDRASPAHRPGRAGPGRSGPRSGGHRAVPGRRGRACPAGHLRAGRGGRPPGRGGGAGQAGRRDGGRAAPAARGLPGRLHRGRLESRVHRAARAGRLGLGGPARGAAATRPTSGPAATWWTAPMCSSRCGTASRRGAAAARPRSCPTPARRACRWRGCLRRARPPRSTGTTSERAAHVAEAAREFREYNAAPIPQFAARARERAGPAGARPGPAAPAPIPRPAQACSEVASWITPYFVRADVLATRLERIFQLTNWTMFLAAAAAVVRGGGPGHRLAPADLDRRGGSGPAAGAGGRPPGQPETAGPGPVDLLPFPG